MATGPPCLTASAPPVSPPHGGHRCIVHLDMDAFYAQVEAVRLGIDCRRQPYALNQWGHFLAVNYPARDAFGIARMDSLWDAKTKVMEVSGALRREAPRPLQEAEEGPSPSPPETLLYSNIPLYRVGLEAYSYYPPNAVDTAVGDIRNVNAVPPSVMTPQHGVGDAPDLAPRLAYTKYNRTDFKVSLEPFRAASKQIFALLRSFPGVEVAKAGIDEAFLDVTEAAKKELQAFAKAKAEAEAAESGDGASCASPPLGTEDGNLPLWCSSLHRLQQSGLLDLTTHLHPDKSEELNRLLQQQYGVTLEAVYDKPLAEAARPSRAGSSSSSPSETEEPVQELLRGFFFKSGLRPSVWHAPSENAEDTDGERPLSLTSTEQSFLAYAALLAAATRVVRRIREQLYSVLHYDCSAGIAHNQLVAKILSASYKPRKQVLLWPHLTSSAIGYVQLKKIRGFGGKLGSLVARTRQFHSRSHDPDAAPRSVDVWAQPLIPGSTSRAARDPRGGLGTYAYYRVRGADSCHISPPRPPHGWTSLKEFPSPERIRAYALLEGWIPALCHDLYCRHRYYEARYDEEQRRYGVAYARVVQLRVRQWSRDKRDETTRPESADAAAADDDVGEDEEDPDADVENGADWGGGAWPAAMRGRGAPPCVQWKREAAMPDNLLRATTAEGAGLTLEDLKGVALTLLRDLQPELLRAAARPGEAAPSGVKLNQTRVGGAEGVGDAGSGDPRPLLPVASILVTFQYSKSRKYLRSAPPPHAVAPEQTLQGFFFRHQQQAKGVGKSPRLRRSPPPASARDICVVLSIEDVEDAEDAEDTEGVHSPSPVRDVHRPTHVDGEKEMAFQREQNCLLGQRDAPAQPAEEIKTKAVKDSVSFSVVHSLPFVQVDDDGDGDAGSQAPPDLPPSGTSDIVNGSSTKVRSIADFFSTATGASRVAAGQQRASARGGPASSSCAPEPVSTLNGRRRTEARRENGGGVRRDDTVVVLDEGEDAAPTPLPSGGCGPGKRRQESVGDEKIKRLQRERKRIRRTINRTVLHTVML
eukprot:gene9982-6966_t